MQKPEREVDVLVVEDCPHDAFLIKKALTHAGVPVAPHIVADGVEASRYLLGEGKYSNRRLFPFPAFLLSDAKMPGMDGFHLIRWLRSNPDCSHVPIIVLSVSNSDADAERAYALGANAYLIKPPGLKEFAELLRATYEFWRHCKPGVTSGATSFTAARSKSPTRSSHRL